MANETAAAESPDPQEYSAQISEADSEIIEDLKESEDQASDGIAAADIIEDSASDPGDSAEGQKPDAEDGIFTEESEDAESSEEISITEGAEESSESESGLADLPASEDQALLSYLGSRLPGKRRIGGKRKISRRDERSILTDNEKVIYDQLCLQIGEILDGTRTSSVLTIDLTQFPSYKTSYTEDDLGCKIYDAETKTWNRDEYMQKLKDLLDFNKPNIARVINALRFDHPESLFWFGRSYSYEVFKAKGSYNTATKAASCRITTTSLRMSLAVASDYAKDYDPDASSPNYAVDPDKINRIHAAAEKVALIVQGGQGMSDLKRLHYYMDEVDSRIEYDHSAAADTPLPGHFDYDPWELISVFDEDPSTNVVCEGYAKAFKYLCDNTSFADSSLNVYLATGTISSGSTSGDHMWNIVQIGGKSYLTDPTWCDYSGAVPGVIDTDKQFMKGGIQSGDNSWTVSWNDIPLGDSGYHISAGKAIYTYDDATIGLYSTGELNLSSACRYDEGGEEEHVWDDGVVVKEATCGAVGSRRYTCSSCGNTRSEEIPRLPHDWKNEWTLTRPATCTSKGIETDSCRNDPDHSRTRDIPVDPEAHDWDQGKITKDPTCIETGVKTYTCTLCSETKTEDIPIDPDAHDWKNEWTVTRPATCTSKGIETDSCRNDPDHTRTRDIPVDPEAHDWDQGKITKDPTCIETGVKTYTCTLCGETKTEDIPIDPDAHEWKNEWTVTRPSTCTSKGIETDTCRNDPDHSRTRDIPVDPDAHEWKNEWTVTRPATCTTKGIETDTCRNDPDHSRTRDIPIDPDAHDWPDTWTLVSEPTALSEGLREKACGHDPQHVIRENIPRLQAAGELNVQSAPLSRKQETEVIYIAGLAPGDYVKSVTSSNRKVVKASIVNSALIEQDGVSEAQRGCTIRLKAGKKTGRAKVTVLLASGQTRVLNLKVGKKKVRTRKIRIECGKNLTLKAGSRVSIGASLKPVTSQDKIFYSSSDKKVVRVTKKGVIRARSSGDAVVTIRSGRKKVRIRVRVE